MMKDQASHWLRVVIFGLLFAARSLAQIDLPQVAFLEPPLREFEVNDNLHLHLQSDTPFDKLRARVFRGSKKDLIARARNAPSGSCVSYPSFLVRYASSNGEVKFGWQFNYYFLNQKSDDGFDNQTYTVVLEKDGPSTIDSFSLIPPSVKTYFRSGQEIELIAPPALQSGAHAKVVDFKKAMERSEASRNASTGNVGTPVAVPCITIRTKQVANTAVPELVLESCSTSGTE
jgi:hypothetical protein